MAIITASPKNMARLIELQEIANENLHTMRTLLEQGQLAQIATLIETKKIDDDNDRMEVVERENLEVDKKTLKANQDLLEVQKEALEQAKKQTEALEEQAKKIEQMVDGIKAIDSIGDRIKNAFSNFREKFRPENIKDTLMKSLNFGGILNKRIAANEFVKKQKALGSDKSEDELREDFKAANKVNQDIKKNDKEIEKFKQLTGLNEEQMAQTEQGKQLLGKKRELSTEYGKYDAAAGIVSGSNSKTKESLEASAETAQVGGSNPEELHLENVKLMDSQTALLEKIEENTRPQTSATAAAAPQQSGGLLSGLGGKLGGAMSGMKNFGIGLLAVAGALWVASKAFANFAEVKWEDVGKGIVALGGLVAMAMVLDKAKGNILGGALAIGAMGVVLWGVAQAFKTFSELDWESIGKGMASIAALGVIGAIAGTAAPLIISGAVALGAMGAALWLVGEAMQAVGEGFEKMTSGIERLGQLDGGNLLKIAAGIGALGLAMAAFGASQAVAGLGNLVSNFLSLGSDSPVEQLIKIGKHGEGVMKAAEGLDKISVAMKKMGEIKRGSMDEINNFPWVRATAFVAAGGAMKVDGAQVYNASKSNAETAEAKKGSGGSGQTNVVNAPTVNNTTKTTQVVKVPVRNQDYTVNQYYRRVYGL